MVVSLVFGCPSTITFEVLPSSGDLHGEGVIIAVHEKQETGGDWLRYVRSYNTFPYYVQSEYVRIANSRHISVNQKRAASLVFTTKVM